MRVATYLRTQIAKKGIRRGDIPALLGFTNVNKTLRRLDAFLEGRVEDAALLDKLISAGIFVRSEYEPLFQADYQSHLRAANIRSLEMEILRRNAFVPHIWIEHEERIPNQIFFVAFIGIQHYKRIDLPPSIHLIGTPQDKLRAVTLFIEEYVANPPQFHQLKNTFGKATHFLYRDTYTHSYVYDLHARAFVGERETAPNIPVATISVKGKQASIPSEVQQRLFGNHKL